jgi:pimeloyl-ACP methyl ester carboxylesterase
MAHGLGGRTLEWFRVQAAVAQFATVISYDRAGFGFSDPGPPPRTADRNLADLRAALQAIGASPPYVLVSHSSGNLEMRLFAYRHPGEVAGMLLLDPTGDDQRERGRIIGQAWRFVTTPRGRASRCSRNLRGRAGLSRARRSMTKPSGQPIRTCRTA